MATPQTIQRVPRGLLDWFGNKGTGDTPSLLNGEVVPTVDIGQLYLSDLVDMQQFTTNVMNLPGLWGVTGAGSSVPPGELWLLHNLSVQFATQLAAGEAYTIRPLITRAQFSKLQIAPTPSSVTAGAGQQPATGWQFERPEILRPADTFGVWVEQVTAGAHAAFVTAYFSRLRT